MEAERHKISEQKSQTNKHKTKQNKKHKNKLLRHGHEKGLWKPHRILLKTTISVLFCALEKTKTNQQSIYNPPFSTICKQTKHASARITLFPSVKGLPRRPQISGLLGKRLIKPSWKRKLSSCPVTHHSASKYMGQIHWKARTHTQSKNLSFKSNSLTPRAVRVKIFLKS